MRKLAFVLGGAEPMSKAVIARLLKNTFDLDDYAVDLLERAVVDQTLSGEVVSSLLESGKVYHPKFFCMIFEAHLDGMYFDSQMFEALVEGKYPEEILMAVSDHVLADGFNISELFSMPTPACVLEKLFNRVHDLEGLGPSILYCALKKRVSNNFMQAIVLKMISEDVFTEHHLDLVHSHGYNVHLKA